MDKKILELSDSALESHDDKDQDKLKGIDPSTLKLVDLKYKNVIVITNHIRELSIFLEHNLYCIYTSNPLDTVNLIQKIVTKEEAKKSCNIKEIYVCLTEENVFDELYYRKYNEESFIIEKINQIGIEGKSIQIDAYKKELQIPSVFAKTNPELLSEYLNTVKESYKNKLNDVEKSFIKNRRSLFRQSQFKKLDAPKISTGFDELDKAFQGGLEEGLYVLTGGSSVGKTAFLTNIAENIAAQKQNVLYYSLEMRESNLISRGISREMYKRNSKSEIGYKDIESGRILNYLDENIDEYSEAEDYYFNYIGQYLTIEEGNLLTTSHVDVFNKTKLIRDMTGQSPIIIVDYLQQMSSANNVDTLKSIIIEQNIAGLKQISKTFETAVLVISSLSRSDAFEAISQQSFAHTSTIEYTADVCMGLSLKIIYSEKFTKDSNLSEKRLLVKEAIAKDTRDIILSIVKNRFGIASKDILMKYEPKFNSYSECPKYMKNFIEVNNIDPPKEFLNNKKIDTIQNQLTL